MNNMNSYVLKMELSKEYYDRKYSIELFKIFESQ